LKNKTNLKGKRTHATIARTGAQETIATAASEATTNGFVILTFSIFLT
jgi:hypothetical protein